MKLWDIEQEGGYSTFSYDFYDRKSYEDDTLGQTSAHISNNLGLDASHNAFSGVLASASDSVHRAKHHEYMSIFQVQKIQTRVTLALGGGLRRMMKQSIVDFIQESDPEHPEILVSSLGMFYAQKIDLGGIFRLIFQEESSSTDSHSNFTRSVQANFSKWALNAAGQGGTGSESSATGSSHRVRSNFRALGAASVWALPGGTYDEKFTTWLHALTDDNLAPVSLALKPIWELVYAVDPQKAKAVETHLRQQWQLGQDNLDILDARPRPIDSCHPWSDHTYKLFVHGWERGQLNKWLGSWHVEYYIAGFDRESDGIPFRFEPVSGQCGTYHLQNMNTHQWLTSCRCEWMHEGNSKADALPIEFHAALGGQQYTMQNKRPGQEHYFSYTTRSHRSCGLKHSRYNVRSTYDQDEAMRVSLHPQTDHPEDAMIVAPMTKAGFVI